MFRSPGYLAFNIGPIDVYWYGIIMAMAILFGLIFVLFIRKKYFNDITVDSIFDISFMLIVFGIIFARLYYVICDFSYFKNNPLEIFAIWNGGISIQGAILGGIFACYLYSKENKLNFCRYADLFSLGLVLGQSIGRWGNFFNSEAFGTPTLLPWKLYIPYLSRPDEYKGYEYFHPTFLYESILNIIVLAILLIIINKTKNRKDGIIFCSYIILYSITRILVESIRLDSVLTIGNLHIAHITSLIFIIFAILLVVIIFKNNKKEIL